MKRLLTVAAPALLLLIGLAGATPAAMAATHPGKAKVQAAAVAPATRAAAPATHATAVPAGCTSTNLCFWNNINFNDGPGKLSGTNSDWSDFAHSTCPSHTWADCASSIFNDGTHCTARVFFVFNFGDPHLDIARGTGFNNLTQVQTGLGVSWNDNIESNDWVNCT